MSRKVKTWQQLEVVVRIVASALYNRKAGPREINGVKCDCVLEIEPDNWVIVEVSKSSTLEKLRTDLSKFATVRPYLFSKQIYSKCYFVTDAAPSDSLRESGRGQNVEVLALHEFGEKLLRFGDYAHIRAQKPVGSAIDPVTGDDDPAVYTPVKYVTDEHGEVDLEFLVDQLLEQKYIVLLGNYGTGKSRCLRELFRRLTEKSQQLFKFPIAVNLRENWGLRRASEIINRHFSDLGLATAIESFMKIHDKPSVCYLLDGFDEIGAQTWSDNPERLKSIRKDSLLGVRDLIQKSSGGCIVSGREHYFNNDAEMVECLGLDRKRPILVRCRDEFDENEISNYLRGIADYETLPSWLPRRPLICQMIRGIPEKTISPLFESEGGEFEFWDELIDFLCEREAQINNALDSQVIKTVLLRLARKTREKEQNEGPLAISEINGVFEETTGSNVTDESAIVLQRLPGLGRVGSDSQDRQFVDNYILDGLRAFDLCAAVESNDNSISDLSWTHVLRPWGLRYMANRIALSGASMYLSYFSRNRPRRNQTMLAEIVAAAALLVSENSNFGGHQIEGSNVSILDLSNASISNVVFESCFFDRVIVVDPALSSVSINGSIILRLEGVTSEHGLPIWIKKTTVEHFESIENVSKIRQTNLTDAQKIFLTIARKLYFQPGSGRKETALFRGLGDVAKKKTVEKVLAVMKAADLYITSPGSEGLLYIPVRKHTRRLQQILDEMVLSKDEIWQRVSKIP